MSNMTNLTHSDGYGKGYGNATLLENSDLCTLQTCDLTMANFLYIPTLPGNALFAGIFGLLLIGQLGIGIKHKTWGYMVAMVGGLVLEIIGYIGRIMIHNNPFNGDAFLMYLVTLTIAPALMTASIYLCLGRIVNVYGESLSRFKSRTYTIVFCTFDLICLILQAAGGAIASSADTKSSSDIGKNIMLAGLIFQVIALVTFMGAASEYAFRVWKGQGMWNQKYQHVVHSLLFKSFLVGLYVATVTILARSIYRCVELYGGFNGELFINHEATFMVLEGAMIVVACSCLTFLHPAICFQGAWHNANFNLRTKNGSHSKLERSNSDEESHMTNVELGSIRK